MTPNDMRIYYWFAKNCPIIYNAAVLANMLDFGIGYWLNKELIYRNSPSLN